MPAKYYIYRNLNRGTAFSVKQRGKVIDYLEQFEADDVEFRVSEAGQRRAMRTKRRNVHAFIVCGKYTKHEAIDTSAMTQVRYNPFRGPTFTRGMRPIKRAKRVVGSAGRAYV